MISSSHDDTIMISWDPGPMGPWAHGDPEAHGDPWGPMGPWGPMDPWEPVGPWDPWAHGTHGPMGPGPMGPGAHGTHGTQGPWAHGPRGPGREARSAKKIRAPPLGLVERPAVEGSPGVPWGPRGGQGVRKSECFLIPLLIPKRACKIVEV